MRLPRGRLKYEQYFNSYLNASIIPRVVFCIFNMCLIGQILRYITVFRIVDFPIVKNLRAAPL